MPCCAREDDDDDDDEEEEEEEEEEDEEDGVAYCCPVAAPLGVTCAEDGLWIGVVELLLGSLEADKGRCADVEGEGPKRLEEERLVEEPNAGVDGTDRSREMDRAPRRLLAGSLSTLLLLLLLLSRP